MIDYMMEHACTLSSLKRETKFSSGAYEEDEVGAAGNACKTFLTNPEGALLS